MKISDETKVGIFAVFALAILFFGFSFMKGRDVFSSNNTYYALYDNILGLQVSNPIVLNGHRIGKVYDIRLQKDNDNKVLVVLSIKGALDLPKGTVARIVDLDILGQKAVELIIGNSEQLYSSKDTIVGETSSGLIGEMMAPYIDKMNESIKEIKQSMGDSGLYDIKETMTKLKLAVTNIEQITDDLNSSNLGGRLGNILAHVESITLSLKENEENISAILSNLNSVTDSLKAANIKGTIDESYAVLKQIEEITRKINSGEGTLSLLVNDNQLYDNLKKTSEDLDKLIIDLKENPGRYVQVSVFGGKSKDKKSE